MLITQWGRLRIPGAPIKRPQRGTVKAAKAAATDKEAMSTLTSKFMPQWRIEDAVTAAFIGALLVMCMVAALAWYSVTQFLNGTRWVDHTHVVLATIEHTNALSGEALSAAQEYVITGDSKRITERDRAISEIQSSLRALAELTADNKAQQERLVNLNSLTSARIEYMSSVLNTRHYEGFEAARSLIAGERPRRLIDDFRESLNAMADEERLLLQRRLLADEDSQGRLIAACGALLLVVVLTVGMGLLRLRRELRLRQTMAEVLERKTIELQTSNKELESFSYSVSHDLRSPLRAIDSFALMLEEDYAAKLDEEGHRYINVIREGAQRMGRLIDDLLSLSRMGREPINAVSIDPRVGAQRAMKEVLVAHAGTPPELLMHKLPLACGDAALLHHVWVNLIGNAVKYSSKSAAPRIEIGGCIHGGEAVYFVKDNGAGFDMRYADKLFRVFQRLHGADEFPGSGVGLAIVQRIITRHGGRVWGESEPEHGAKFYFTLPQAAIA
jgi:signal transduction histidine kinase